MITINVFDSPVVLHHCNDREIFSNENIKNSITFVFSLDEIRESVDQSQLGNAFSTCGYYNKFPLPLMPGAEQLSEWVAKRILESASQLGFKDTTKVEFVRTWANMMFFGCEGTCHSHPADIDGVAVFYSSAPVDSGELVFVQRGIDGTRVSQYAKEQLQSQPIKSGDLIIHKPYIPHAVSRHNSHDPRLSFIYEFKYQ